MSWSTPPQRSWAVVHLSSMIHLILPCEPGLGLLFPWRQQNRPVRTAVSRLAVAWCVSVFAADQLNQAEQRKADEGQQCAFGNTQTEKGPGHLGAVCGAAEQQGKHLEYRQYIHHVVEAGQAGGQLVGWLVLQPDLTAGGGAAEYRKQSDAEGI